MIDRRGSVVRTALAVVAATALAAGCAGTGNEGGEAPADTTTGTPATTTAVPAAGDPFPDIVGAVAEVGDDGTWRFDVTVSSPYDTAERYADAWRILTGDGDVLGVRELAHDHQNEQPFTRSLSGVVIPGSVDRVTIEGRDQVNGWGGQTFELELAR